ncbi:MAG: homogentisate phytyltransferase [Elainellaceae cyanobacterium]
MRPLSTPQTPPPAKPHHTSLITWLRALWRFSRPHTIVGTTLSVLSLFTLAIADPAVGFPGNLAAPMLDVLVPGPLVLGVLVLGALLACLCGNVYIVGLNQIEDVEIDRINKPHLPIAAGIFSRRQGWWIVGLCGGVALVSSLAQGRFLAATVWSSLVIGTLYSLPPVRLKRFPFWASVCIFTVRGVIVNLGLFLHFSDRLGQPTITPAVWVLTAFVLVFTFAIAILKDIPDIEGDRCYQIRTFTVQAGPGPVFRLALWTLTLCYAGMIAAALLLPSIHTGLIVATHLLALGAIWVYGQRVSLAEKRSIARFYQFVWRLFFLEYILFPVACLLAVAPQ